MYGLVFRIKLNLNPNGFYSVDVFFFWTARTIPPVANNETIQKIEEVPNAVPNAPKINGNITWLPWMIVSLNPKASATRPTGAVEWTSVMIFGCAAPSPNPSAKAIKMKNK